jgi:hypothetical protein
MDLERFAVAALLSALALATACTERAPTTPPDAADEPDTADAAPDTTPIDATPIVLRGAKVMTAAGASFAPGAVILVGDSIHAVGPVAEVAIPEGATIIELDAAQVITPGIIDTHSHMGVYSSPGLNATGDGNEMAGRSRPTSEPRTGFGRRIPSSPTPSPAGSRARRSSRARPT